MARLAALAAVAAALAGCAAQGVAPPARAAVAGSVIDLPSAGTREFVFTCQNGTVFDCLVYNGRGTLLRTLTTDVESPLGVAAGRDGRLYVANEFSDNVLVYSAGGKSLLHELDDGGNVPIDVAVFRDELAVSNEHTLTFFKAGATKPTRTLTDSSVLQGSGAAFDANGNCYWSFSTEEGGSQVDEFAGCKGSAIQLNVKPGSPYGMAFDQHGNLYYTSYSSSADGIYRCTGTKSCKLVYSQFVDPEYVNFSGDFKRLWLNDPANVTAGAAMFAVDVKTGKVVETITSGLTFFNPPTGVASAPGPL